MIRYVRCNFLAEGTVCFGLPAVLLALSLNAASAIRAIKFGKLWGGHRVANAVVIVENDKVQSASFRRR